MKKLLLIAAVVASLSGCVVAPVDPAVGVYTTYPVVESAYIWEPTLGLWYWNDGYGRHYMNRGWAYHGGYRGGYHGGGGFHGGYGGHR